jgi:hypothetical protein
MHEFAMQAVAFCPKSRKAGELPRLGQEAGPGRVSGIKKDVMSADGGREE